MTVETPEWVNELKAMPFDDLVVRFTPLIAKYSRWRIPGYEPEDIRQEILTALWKCQRNFDPANRKGFNGKQSSFINYLITSIENTLGKAPRRFSQSYYMPITGLECRGCGTMVEVANRPTCPSCGGKRWKAIHGGSLVSFDNELVSYEPAVDGFEDDATAMADAMRMGLDHTAIAEIGQFVEERDFREVIAGARGTRVCRDCGHSLGSKKYNEVHGRSI